MYRSADLSYRVLPETPDILCVAGAPDYLLVLGWQETGWGCMLKGTPRSPGGRGSEKQGWLVILRSCQEPVSTLLLPHQEPESIKKKKVAQTHRFPKPVPLQREP